MLSDLEFRVWEQYQHSADDFGVMRMSYLTIQDDNAALAKRPGKVITKALGAILAVKLVYPFTHQTRAYICQLDWQDFQKKKYAKETQQPKPPSDVLALCTAATQHLFQFHPGKLSIPAFEKSSQNDSKNVSEISANSLRNISHSRETHTHTQPLPQTQTQPQRDLQWEEFKAAYPAQGREQGFMALQFFLKGCDDVGFPVLLAGAQRYATSKSVRGGFVMGMQKWLERGLWIQEPEVETSQADSTAKMAAELAKIDAARAARGR